MESAFYEPAGPDTYVATAATIGPWSDDAQHGGPPSALAGRALERHEPDERQRLARVAIDILRPVPVGKVSLRTRMVRPGRRVTLVEAVMESDGQEVLHARGWRIERPAGDVPEVADGGGLPAPVPSASAGLAPPIFQARQHGYLASIEWRFTPGTSADLANSGRGQASRGSQSGTVAPVRAAWTRPRIPLLPDEEPSPMSRALLVADSGSGVGSALPVSDFIFINVDLSVILSRDPVGDWLLLESSTAVGPDGTGLAATRLADPLGGFGRGWQTLLIAPR
ncbi:MAG TPA: thioesterase family protein [Streptosporangiaceae bacterium]